MQKKREKINAEEMLEQIFSSFDDPSVNDGERLLIFRSAADVLDRSGADNISRATVWNAVGMLIYRTGGGTRQEEVAFGYALNLLKSDRNAQGGELLPTVTSNLAECLLRSGRLKRAEKLFNEAQESFFSSGNYVRFAQTASYRAECLYRLKGAEAASSAVTGYLKKLGRRSDEDSLRAAGTLLTARAVIHGNAGKKRAAVRDFTKMIKLYRGSVMYDQLMSAYAGRSVALETVGRLGRALEDAETAVEMTRLAFDIPDDLYRYEMSNRCHVLGRLEEKRGNLEKAAKYYIYAAYFISCCDSEVVEGMSKTEKEAMSFFRAAWCHSRCDGQLYYDALLEYGKALELLEKLPEEVSGEHKRAVLESRADIYEAFGEDGLAIRDLLEAQKISPAR